MCYCVGVSEDRSNVRSVYGGGYGVKWIVKNIYIHYTYIPSKSSIQNTAANAPKRPAIHAQE